MFNLKFSLQRARQLFRKIHIDRAGFLFGMRAAATAWVAFSVASMLHVQNGYWAAMAAWIVMQPTRGILLERGFYRLIGTLTGATAGFAILHWIHQPYWAVLLLSLWVAACASLTHLFRHVSSYGAMLAGITAVVVAMPTLHAGDQTFDLALSRLVCTLIGVSIATAGALLFVPPSPRPAFLARMRRVAGDAVEFAAHEFVTHDAESTRRMARELIEEMASLEQAMVINTAGMLRGKHRINHLLAFIGAALEVMAAAQTAATRQRLAGKTAPSSLPGALTTLAEYLQLPKVEESSRLVLEQAIEPARQIDARLAAALEDLLAAEADILSGEDDPGRHRFRKAPVPHDKDWQSAGLAGAVTGLAVFCAGCAALLFSWAFAPLAALGVGNFVMILSSLDRPQLMAPKIFQGICSGVIAATLFRLYMLPLAQGTPDIVLMVLPFLVIGGLLRASRITTHASIDFVMCFMLAGQPFLPAETAVAPILEGGLALVLGAGFVVAGFMLLPRDPGRRVQALARLIVHDIERMADLAMEPGSHWRQLMARRLLRLTAHLGRIESLRNNEAEDVLAALNMAHAIVELRDLQALPGLEAAERNAIEAAIQALRHLSGGREAFVAALDSSLDAIAQSGAAPSDSPAAALLPGIRVSLEQGVTILLPDAHAKGR